MARVYILNDDKLRLLYVDDKKIKRILIIERHMEMSDPTFKSFIRQQNIDSDRDLNKERLLPSNDEFERTINIEDDHLPFHYFDCVLESYQFELANFE